MTDKYEKALEEMRQMAPGFLAAGNNWVLWDSNTGEIRGITGKPIARERASDLKRAGHEVILLNAQTLKIHPIEI